MALAVRLRRLSDTMIKDGRKLYQYLEADIEPNWFLVLLLLKDHPMMSITEIADALKFAHPSIHAIVNKLIKKGYVVAYGDKADKRRRRLQLSQTGQQKIVEMEPVWEAGNQGISAMLQANESDILEELNKLEQAFAEKGFMERTLEEMKNEKLKIDNGE